MNAYKCPWSIKTNKNILVLLNVLLLRYKGFKLFQNYFNMNQPGNFNYGKQTVVIRGNMLILYLYMWYWHFLIQLSFTKVNVILSNN